MLQGVLMSVYTWLGVTDTLCLAAANWTMTQELLIFFQRRLANLRMIPRGGIGRCIEQLFDRFIQPVINAQSAHAPRPPRGLVRPERRVQVRHISNERWPPLHAPLQVQRDRLHRAFPFGAFAEVLHVFRAFGRNFTCSHVIEHHHYRGRSIREHRVYVEMVLVEVFEVRCVVRFSDATGR